MKFQSSDGYIIVSMDSSHVIYMLPASPHQEPGKTPWEELPAATKPT